MRRILTILFLATVLSCAFSCRKDNIETNSSATLNFSTDSILFDTVFTTMGSTTKRLKVYNRNNDKIIISSISLENGNNSPFRINVDGASGNTHSNIEIEGNDSIFIFIEVTIDPNSLLSPFVINETLLFTTNGNKQSIQLAAWGQNAHYFVANKNVGGIPLVYLDKDNSNGALNVTWTNDKPYVIYGGYLTLDGDDQLTIEKGVRVHLHNSSGIWVYQGGNIQVNGTVDSNVTFQGTRLEYAWQDVPGQWDRIWINEGSNDNVFNYAVIKNAFIGLQVEPLPFDPTPRLSTNRLRLNNCMIQNSSAVAILATNYLITDTNSIFSNSGQFNLYIKGGGEYQFNHTTIANYWDQGIRETPSVLVQNYYTDVNGSTVPIATIDSVNFYNCIVHGNLDVEFDTDIISSGTVNYKFVNSILKTTNSTSGSNYVNIIKNPSAELFIDKSIQNYHLAVGSAAINAGIASGVLTDHDGVIRNNPPDIGAYED